MLSLFGPEPIIHRRSITFGTTGGIFDPSLESLRDRCSFLDYLAPLREAEWVVYAKKPFAGPEQVLDYVGAISSGRTI
jgi:hypothetical protein